jgi:hypothetical protein
MLYAHLQTFDWMGCKVFKVGIKHPCTVQHTQPVPVEGRQSNSLFRDSVDFAILLARIGLRCTVSSPVFYWAENIRESASELHARRGRWTCSKFWRIVLCRPTMANYKERKRDMVIFNYYIYNDIAIRNDIIVLDCTTYISFFCLLNFPGTFSVLKWLASWNFTLSGRNMD